MIPVTCVFPVISLSPRHYRQRISSGLDAAPVSIESDFFSHGTYNIYLPSAINIVAIGYL